MRSGIGIFFFLLLSDICAGQTYFEYYQNGLNYADSDSLNLAIDSFEKALKIRGTDDKQARTYGVHFIEYFPNRELGIIYYKLNNLDLAIKYLEKSMNVKPSERAKECLLNIGQVKHDLTLSIVDDNFPEIEILSPAMVNQKIFQPVPNYNDQISLVGRAKDAGGVFEVIVNDQKASVSASGDFKAKINLKVGDNDIYVKATDMSRNSITKTYFIHRDDTVISEIASLTEADKYYALIIGISDYTDPNITDLEGYPMQDAERLYQILTGRYRFDKEHVRLLKNPNRP